MSSGLLFLSAEDFHIVNGPKSDIMCHKIPGLSLIFFYSTNCAWCKPLIPIFRKLPGTIGGCQFGMLNVSTSKTCVRMSKGTRTEIKYVPYILLYVNGRPVSRYNGPQDKDEISRFVIEMSKQLNSRQKFTPQANSNLREDTTAPNQVPVYGGVPLKGFDDVCYLEIDDAYTKDGKRKNRQRRQAAPPVAPQRRAQPQFQGSNYGSQNYPSQSGM